MTRRSHVPVCVLCRLFEGAFRRDAWCWWKARGLTIWVRCLVNRVNSCEERRFQHDRRRPWTPYVSAKHRLGGDSFTAALKEAGGRNAYVARAGTD